MATHLLDWVDGNTSKILEIKVDFKGQYVSVLRFFSTCQRLVSYDSSATSSMGAFFVWHTTRQGFWPSVCSLQSSWNQQLMESLQKVCSAWCEPVSKITPERKPCSCEKTCKGTDWGSVAHFHLLMDQDKLGRAEEGQMTSFPMETSEPVAATEFQIWKKKLSICSKVILFNTFKHI